MFKKTMSLASSILLLWAAALASNYFFHYFQGRPRALTQNPNGTTSWPDPSYLYTFAVFAIGLVSFVGFLNISRELRGSRDTFQDGDVRFALTCSFVTVFFALLSFFSFARVDQPTEIGRSFFSNFLTITVLIVGFYFATSGAIELVRLRQDGKRQEGAEAGAKPLENHKNHEIHE